MIILVLNCGSSSVKFQLIETSPEQITNGTGRRLAQGEVERIGQPASSLTGRTKGETTETKQVPATDHQAALDVAFEWMLAHGVLSHPDEIAGVGHRVVHGGSYFHQSVVVDGETLPRIEACNDLAPLHNPHNLEGYFAARKWLPKAIQVAVFDTAFHQSLPARAYLYGVPREWHERWHIRRYGFHGTSHRYLMNRFAELHRVAPEAFKLITCHLGNGCSVCAIEHGRSVDTSMGFTPLEGLLMGTRPGDVDAGALVQAVKKYDLDADKLEMILNEQSGLLGLSGLSGDMREILKAAESGYASARDAVDVFCYRASKCAAAYFAVLGGAQAIIFAGGIGENAPEIRKRTCHPLAALGIHVDDKLNAAAVSVEMKISTTDSSVDVWVIPTDEERLIAHDTVQCIQNLERLGP